MPRLIETPYGPMTVDPGPALKIIVTQTLFQGVIVVPNLQVGPTQKTIDGTWGKYDPSSTKINSVTLHYVATPSGAESNASFTLILNGGQIASESWLLTFDTRDKTVPITLNPNGNTLVIIVDRFGLLEIDMATLVEVTLDYTGAPPNPPSQQISPWILVAIGGISLASVVGVVVFRELRKRG